MSNSRDKAAVYREHTLGVMRGDNEIEVLYASVLKGSPFGMYAGVVPACLSGIRPATKADFEEFRVRWHPDYQLEASTPCTKT